MEEIKRGRGRPRTQEVIDRDAQILQLLASAERPLTKYEISTNTGVPPTKVYTSLRRLAHKEQLSRIFIINKQHYWSDRVFDKSSVNLTSINEHPALIPAAVFSSPE